MSDHTYEEVSAMIESSMSRIKYKILVGSGRGGVGKSTFAVNLAYGLMFHGNSVGILDADIHGPSLGKMLGIEGQKNPPSLNELIQPVEKNGIKVISISSFIQNPDDPIAWRGPVKGSVLRQFLGEVEWVNWIILL